jgi:hypothetical protein
VATIEKEKFKKALFPVSTLVFYEYGGRLYYPYSMEFRLIDNNILFLIEELGVKSVSLLFKMLESSMEKEEKWSNVFESALIHLSEEPRFMHQLSEDFKMDIITREVYSG